MLPFNGFPFHFANISATGKSVEAHNTLRTAEGGGGTFHSPFFAACADFSNSTR